MILKELSYTLYGKVNIQTHEGKYDDDARELISSIKCKYSLIELYPIEYREV